MATLREKMKQEMILIGLAESTQQRYVASVTKLQTTKVSSPYNRQRDKYCNPVVDCKDLTP